MTNALWIVLCIGLIVGAWWYTHNVVSSCEQECAAAGLGHVMTRGYGTVTCTCMPHCSRAPAGTACVP